MESARPIGVPSKRTTSTYELVIMSSAGRFKLYLSIGLDEAGMPIEIWLDCAKEGTMLREFMHGWASLFSLALQHRVPLARLVNLYKGWSFEPCGRVEGFPSIESCTSVLSLVVSVLAAEFPQAVVSSEGQGKLWGKK